MHISMADVVVGMIVLLAWSALILYRLRCARLDRQRSQRWNALMLSHPDLDRELEQIWQRR